MVTSPRRGETGSVKGETKSANFWQGKVACTTRVRKTEVRTTPVRSQQCECQQCEGVNSANETRVRMPTVRMPAVRMRQQCERRFSEPCKTVPSVETTRSRFFDKRFASFFTHLSHTRYRRLASEIPLELSTLVAVDRLTSFDSVRRRCTKALRKQQQCEESNLQRRNGQVRTLGKSPFRLLSTGPCLHCVTVHCLASSQRSVTSPRKDTTSFPLTKTDRAV